MTATSFAAWRERHKLTAKAAAEALGCSRATVAAYEAGKTPVPRYIALACQAIANGLPPMA